MHVLSYIIRNYSDWHITACIYMPRLYNLMNKDEMPQSKMNKFL